MVWMVVQTREQLGRWRAWLGSWCRGLKAEIVTLTLLMLCSGPGQTGTLLVGRVLSQVHIFLWSEGPETLPSSYK